MCIRDRLSTANYDNTLIGWASQSVQSNVRLIATGLEYCAGESARNTLISMNGWVISNDSKCPTPPRQSNPSAGDDISKTKVEAYETPSLSTFEKVKVYPNPTNGELTINYDLSTDQDVEILVRDLSGKLLYRKQIAGVEGENEGQLNLSTYTKGLYLLQLKSGERNVTRKVVKH